MFRREPTRYSLLAARSLATRSLATRSLAIRFAFTAALLGAAIARADDPSPPKATDAIVVTATRVPTRLGDTPASIVVLPAAAIEASAAATLDDALRQVPGFT